MPNVDLRLAFSSLLKPQKNLHKLFLIEKTEDDDDDNIIYNRSYNNNNNNNDNNTENNNHNDNNNLNNNVDGKLFAINLLETLKSAAIKGLGLVKKSFSKSTESAEVGNYCQFD
jgi:hypothetical protein